MKSGKKALLLALCAVLLVAATVMGTMAYLTATDKVENTFTIGSVGITLDEAQVGTDGKAVTPEVRVKENSYKLMPGHKYDKDPTVHVVAGSEDSYIFVKVENGISAYEAPSSSGYSTITEQMGDKGWVVLTTSAGSAVYYKPYTSATGALDFVVFENFKIANDADKVNGWGDVSGAKITITAYAVQQDGFDGAEEAWAATFGKA